MDTGHLLVYFGLGTTLLSILFYALSLRGSRRMLLAARGAFALASIATVASFGRLMYLCANHQFQFQYVFDYTSPDLGWPFVYAATWAGQEGSFLLWAFWTALIGGLVAWKAGKWENRVMPFYLSTLAVLFAICVWLSPFNLIPRGTGPGQYPPDLPWPPEFGKGLNPSLQNYWMAIHPPTIFFGFVSLSIPFAYAIAAMIWRDYGSSQNQAGWAPRVMPWTLMAVATLGAGLFLGGYWAYETQGWHGFWAWDPVENASLFPWLASLGLAHGLIVQKSRGGMGRTNIMLAVLAWVLFLWGTFLTRSGVLANFSVHAFGMLHNSALYLIIGMIAGHGLLGVGLLAWRWRSIPGRPISERVLSRDSAMVMAITLMIVAAVVITVGTSWPLISRWTVLKAIGGNGAIGIGAKVLIGLAALVMIIALRRTTRGSGFWVSAAAIGLLAAFVILFGLQMISQNYSATGVRAEPLFYNRVGTALLIPALILMAIVPYLAWSTTNVEKFLWKIIPPWFLAIAGGFALVWFVLHEVSIGFIADTRKEVVVAVGTLGLFAFFANMILVLRIVKPRATVVSKWVGGTLSLVVGVALLLAVFAIWNGALGSDASLAAVTVAWVAALLCSLAAFALGVRILAVRGLTLGGWLAHAGIGLLFLGTVITNVYEKTETFNLVEGFPPIRTSFGYDLRYVGWTHEGKSPEEQRREWFEFSHGLRIQLTKQPQSAGAARADEGDHEHKEGEEAHSDPHAGLNPHAGMDPHAGLNLGATTGGSSKSSIIAHLPVFHHVQLMGNEDPQAPTTMRWPYIKRELHRDFYVAVAADPKLIRASATVKPGETSTVGVPGLYTSDYKVRYRRYFMDGEPGMVGTVMGAEIDLITPEGKAIALRPGVRLGGDMGPTKVIAPVDELGGAVMLDGMIKPDTKEATLAFDLPGAPATWVVPLAVTNKPMINLVWIGVVMMTLGTLVAMTRRAVEARKGVLLEHAAAAGVSGEEGATAETPADAASGVGAAAPSPAGGKRRPARAT